MYDTITTKYSTRSKSGKGRICVQSTSKRRIYVPWDYALGTEANHKAAAKVLILDLGWEDMDWYFGAIDLDVTSFVFVQVPKSKEVAKAATLFL